MNEVSIGRLLFTLIGAAIIWVTASVSALQTITAQQEVHIQTIIKTQANLVASTARINGIEVSLANIMKTQDSIREDIKDMDP